MQRLIGQVVAAKTRHQSEPQFKSARSVTLVGVAAKSYSDLDFSSTNDRRLRL
jgi:hypothetical protein